MFSISRRDGIFIFLAFAFSFFAIRELINIFGGPALGAPPISDMASVFLLVGVITTTLIAFMCTRWIRRAHQSAIRGAVGGAITVGLSAIIGMLIFYLTLGHSLELTDLLTMSLASFAFLPVGMILGAMTYGIRQKK